MIKDKAIRGFLYILVIIITNFSFLISHYSLFIESFESVRQVLDEVTGNDTLLAEVPGGNVTCQTMEVHANDTSVFLFVASRQQSGDDTRQYVATASCRHTGITGGVENDMTVRQTEGRVMGPKTISK